MTKHERKSLYMQIQDHFKELIVSGELKEHDKIPSEEELIKQFGVSRITVANALTGLAESGWIYRFPRRGSFVSGEVGELIRRGPGRDEAPLAVPTRRPATERETSPGGRQIGLLIQTIDSYYAIRLIRGIEEELLARGYELVILLTRNSKDLEERAIDQLLRMGVKGLLIYPSDAETYNEAIIELKFKRFPFVLVDRYLPGIETHYVGSANKVGARMAIAHLWDIGHRKIAICSDIYLPTVTAEDRIRGYMEEMMERKAVIDPALMLTDIEADGEIGPDHPLYRYVAARNATAYFVVHSGLALKIANVAMRIGLRIPEDLSLITFDDPMTGYEGPGSITHISQSEEEIGANAARILSDLLEQAEAAEAPHAYRKVVFTPSLVTRFSTGPAAVPAESTTNK